MLPPSSTSGISKPWLIATVFWFLSVAVFAYLNHLAGTRYTLCLFKNLTDLPCPGCGGTRATLALLKGHWLAAFAFNPLVSSIFVLSPLFILSYGWNARKKNAERWQPGRTFWIITIALVLGNWLYVIRNLP